MQTGTIACALVLAWAAACGGSSAHGDAGARSWQRCDHPFPASLLLAANASSVVRMTATGPKGLLPGARGVGPHHLAVSHSRCAVAIVTEGDDSDGPLVVGSDGSKMHLHRAVGPANGIAWSPDDRRLAVSYQLGPKSSVEVVDVASGDARVIARFRGGPIAYGVAWSDDSTVLVARLAAASTRVDAIGVQGTSKPFLTAATLGAAGIDPNTFTVDAARHRLLLAAYSGTLARQRERRLVWVDLQTRHVSPAMEVPLGRLDAPFGAVSSPNGRDLAFMVGRIGGGRYRCTIVDGRNRTELPGNDQCYQLAWG